MSIDEDIGIEGIHLSHTSFSIHLFSIKGNISPKIKCPKAEWFRVGPTRSRRSDVMLQRRKQHFDHLNAVCQWGMLELLYRFLRNHPSFLLISAFSPHVANKRDFTFELPTHEPFHKIRTFVYGTFIINTSIIADAPFFVKYQIKISKKKNPFQSTDSITRPAYFPQTSPPARDTGMEEYRYLLKIRNLWKT
jgi:hypothetical protein